jgi:pyruvate dehydrogenase E1 component alpha subunit
MERRPYDAHADDITTPIAGAAMTGEGAAFPGAKAADLACVDRAAWLSLLRCMVMSRAIEERLIRLYHQAQIYGGVYTGVGQEAIGAATAAAAGEADLFAPAIRNLTVHLARGETPANVFRQWLARATGPTRGRDGNVHFGSASRGVYTMISHLGAMLPVVVGGVMARRHRGLDTIGIAYIGDGATSTGDFHEAVNFASVFDVPVLFVIENNKYAYSTPNRLQFRCARLADRAAGYGIRGLCTDGNDAVGLHLLARDLIARMRKEPRPVLLECDTLRMRGHGEHDDFSYVPADLLTAYAARDPIRVAAARLAGADIVEAAALAALEHACAGEVEAAYREALADPPPDPATLHGGVYGDG